MVIRHICIKVDFKTADLFTHLLQNGDHVTGRAASGASKGI
jgi:hypothetical protein